MVKNTLTFTVRMNSDEKSSIDIWNNIGKAYDDGYRFFHTNSFIENGEVWFTCAMMKGYNTLSVDDVRVHIGAILNETDNSKFMC